MSENRVCASVQLRVWQIHHLSTLLPNHPIHNTLLCLGHRVTCSLPLTTPSNSCISFSMTFSSCQYSNRPVPSWFSVTAMFYLLHIIQEEPPRLCMDISYILRHVRGLSPSGSIKKRDYQFVLRTHFTLLHCNWIFSISAHCCFRETSSFSDLHLPGSQGSPSRMSEADDIAKAI